MTEQDIAAKMATLTDAIEAAIKKVDDVVVGLETVRDEVSQTKEIVEAWNAVKTGGKFLKWLGGVVAAVVAIIAAGKLGISHLWGK